MLSEIREMVDESSRKLHQISLPPVRFWLLYDVMKKPLDDPQVQQAVAECRAYPPRLRLLNSLRSDGTWPLPKQKMLDELRGPGQPVGWTYSTILRNLYVLGDYDTDRTEGNVQAALDWILKWQTKDGDIPGPTSAAYAAPDCNGFALRDLVQFGMGNDPRTQRIVKWLLSVQRHDGGWNIPYAQDVRYLPQYSHMRIGEFRDLVESDERPPHDPDEYQDIPSCIWTTLMVLRGMYWDKSLKTCREARHAAEFVLDRFFKRNYHPSYHQSESHWTKLKYPSFRGSGLIALEVLTNMGYGPEDERMDAPIKWLMSVRARDSLWYRTDRPNPEKDQWITEIALSALARYANLY
jgi:hypothetical protein